MKYFGMGFAVNILIFILLLSFEFSGLPFVLLEVLFFFLGVFLTFIYFLFFSSVVKFLEKGYKFLSI